MSRLAKWMLYSAAMLALGAACARAESFSGNLLVRPQFTHEKSGATTTSEDFPASLFNWTFTSGDSTNQMNQLWVSRTTLTNSQSATYNLVGSVTNSFGTVLTMAEVRMLLVSSDDANLDAVTIGGAAANAFSTWAGDPSDTITLRPGGLVLLVAPDAAGYAVSTNGNLKVTNAGTNPATIDIYVGASDQ